MASVSTPAETEREAQPEAAGEGRRLLVGLANEHAAHDLEVIVDGHRDIQGGDDGQRVVAGLDQREEDVVLAEEARGGRDAGERKQEDQHQEGVAGTLVDQARHIVQVLADDVGAAHRDDDEERAEVHEGVDHDVDGDRR